MPIKCFHWSRGISLGNVGENLVCGEMIWIYERPTGRSFSEEEKQKKEKEDRIKRLPGL
jgi:hypothetical protein